MSIVIKLKLTGFLYFHFLGLYGGVKVKILAIFANFRTFLIKIEKSNYEYLHGLLVT